MPNKVIALVFAHNGDNEYEQTASTGTKRLLRKANAALTAHYGHRVGTVFGDPRGKSPTGDDVLSYAVCMTTPAEDVPWLLKTFWDQDSAGYVEVAPNVGYHNTSRGRARFFALDVSKGDEGANHYLAELTGLDLRVKPDAPIVPKATKVTATSESDFTKHLDAGALKALLDVGGNEYASDATRDQLLEQYIVALTAPAQPALVEPEPEPTVDDEPVDMTSWTKAQLREAVDERGLTYRKADTNAQLLALLN